jgi:ergothioneine biosynthesis protein EgtB
MGVTSPTQATLAAARDLRARYETTRARSLKLTRGLSAEDQALQSMPDASPTKWHLAHTTWFFETFFLRDRLGYRVFDERFGYLFNSYYNAEGDRHARAERGLLSRPSLDDVHAYRAHVDAALLGAIDSVDPNLLALGLAHEEQHQELMLMDVKHLFSRNIIAPAYQPGGKREPGARPAPIEGIKFRGALFELGHDGDGFAFDNEGPRHKVVVEPFAFADRLVTAGEYLAFINDGGYTRPEFWLSDGWDAVQAHAWGAPLYWHKRDGGWRIFTLQGERALDPHEPVVHVSYYEADAFARWSDARLPTEVEWEFAAVCAQADPQTPEAPHLHPRPAARTSSVKQMFGEAWQWTQSAYSPYPRYRPTAGAIGEYNGKFMCNQMVLRGSSVATPPGHARATYRNFFGPAARWAFSGIRIARDE